MPSGCRSSLALAAGPTSSAAGYPAGFYPAYRKQLRRFFVLCCVAAAALVVSVISDGVLTALLLRGTELSAGFLVPVFSMAIEIVCVGILVFHICGITRRTASTAALLNM